jgi:hypothetical protein
MSEPRAALGVVGLRGLQTGAKLAVPYLRKLCERDAERVDHAQEVEEAHVRLAALDCADVVAVHVRAHAQALLAESVARAQLAHGTAECEERFVVCGSSAAHKAY